MVKLVMKSTEKQQVQEATQRILLIARQSTAGSFGVKWTRDSLYERDALLSKLLETEKNDEFRVG